MSEPKQQKLNSPIVFTDEEWGKHELSDEEKKKSKQLWDKLPQNLKDELSERNHRYSIRHLCIYGSEIGDKLPRHLVGQVSEVQCLFCKNGCLKLARIEPLHSGGVIRRCGYQEHIGNICYYACTEAECGATFCYKIQWMRID